MFKRLKTKPRLSKRLKIGLAVLSLVFVGAVGADTYQNIVGQQQVADAYTRRGYGLFSGLFSNKKNNSSAIHYDEGSKQFEPTVDTTAAKNAAKEANENTAKMQAENSSSKSDKEKTDKTAGGTGDRNTVGYQGQYKEFFPYSILTSAYHDGQVNGKTKVMGDAQVTPYETLTKDVTQLVSIDNGNGHGVFSNIGAIIGPITATGTSNTNNVSVHSTMTFSGFSARPYGNSGYAYWTFGRAVHDIMDHGKQADRSSLTGQSIVGSITGMPGTVVRFGFQILSDYNPAPILLSFLDASQIKNADTANNQLVAAVGNQPFFMSIINTLGGPMPGVPGVSVLVGSFFLISLFMLVLSAVITLFSGGAFGRRLRSIIFKTVVIAVSIPLGAYILTKGIDYMTDQSQEDSNEQYSQIIDSDLWFEEWAQTSFAIPAGDTLKTSDDEQFTFSSGQIRRININSWNLTHPGSGSQIDINNPSDADLKMLAGKIQSAAESDGNKTTITWDDAYDKSGQPYNINKMGDVADTIATPDTFDKKSISQDDLNKIGYLSDAGLWVGGTDPGSDNNNSTFYMDGNSNYGLTPVAGYNIINTTFSSDGMHSTDNLTQTEIPKVAIGADLYGPRLDDDTQPAMPGLLKTIFDIIMMLAAFKAMARIFTAGVGGLLGGGAKAAAGSAAGAGQVVGSALALVGGIIGCAIIMMIVNSLLDVLWGLVFQILSGMTGGFISGNLTIPYWTWTIPLIGPMVSFIFSSLSVIIMSILSLMFIPQFLKVPFQAFGSYMAEMPTKFAEKVKFWEDRFTGMQRGPSMGGSFGQHLASKAEPAVQAAKEKAQRQKQLAGKAAGATAMSILSKVTGKNSEKNNSSSTSTKGKDSMLNQAGKTDKSLLNNDSNDTKTLGGTNSDEKTATNNDGAIENTATNNQSAEKQQTNDNKVESSLLDANGNPIPVDNPDSNQSMAGAGNGTGAPQEGKPGTNQTKQDVNAKTEQNAQAQNSVDARDQSVAEQPSEEQQAKLDADREALFNDIGAAAATAEATEAAERIGADGDDGINASGNDDKEAPITTDVPEDSLAADNQQDPTEQQVQDNQTAGDLQAGQEDSVNQDLKPDASEEPASADQSDTLVQNTNVDGNDDNSQKLKADSTAEINANQGDTKVDGGDSLVNNQKQGDVKTDIKPDATPQANGGQTTANGNQSVANGGSAKTGSGATDAKPSNNRKDVPAQQGKPKSGITGITPKSEAQNHKQPVASANNNQSQAQKPGASGTPTPTPKPTTGAENSGQSGKVTIGNIGGATSAATKSVEGKNITPSGINIPTVGNNNGSVPNDVSPAHGGDDTYVAPGEQNMSRLDRNESLDNLVQQTPPPIPNETPAPSNHNGVESAAKHNSGISNINIKNDKPTSGGSSESINND